MPLYCRIAPLFRRWLECVLTDGALSRIGTVLIREVRASQRTQVNAVKICTKWKSGTCWSSLNQFHWRKNRRWVHKTTCNRDWVYAIARNNAPWFEIVKHFTHWDKRGQNHRLWPRCTTYRSNWRARDTLWHSKLHFSWSDLEQTLWTLGWLMVSRLYHVCHDDWKTAFRVRHCPGYSR